MRERPSDDEIESVIENIPPAWTATGWEESNNSRSGPARLTVELEYIPPADRLDHPRGAVKHIVDLCDDGDGAPIERVIDEAVAELDAEREAVEGKIEVLRTKGEVYEPIQGMLRTT